MRLVELAKSCAPRVHQVNAGVAGARRERLAPNPAADQCRNDIAVHRRIVETRPSVAQCEEGAENRASSAERP